LMVAGAEGLFAEIMTLSTRNNGTDP
jgi:hypothetical protein